MVFTINVTLSDMQRRYECQEMFTIAMGLIPLPFFEGCNALRDKSRQLYSLKRPYRSKYLSHVTEVSSREDASAEEMRSRG